MRKILFGLVAALGIAGCGIAFAAGLWPGLPTIANTSGGSFTGVETFPLDTNVAAGAGPATILMTTPQIGQGLIFTNTGGASTTIANNTPTFIQPAATAQTITLPSAPVHGQIQRIAVVGAQGTSITIAANTGQTCTPACPFNAGAAAAGSGLAWTYNAPAAQWIKIQ